MSNSSLVNYTRISPNRTYGRTSIKTVAIHCMAGHLSVESCGNLFASSARAASSNYGIDDKGRVGMYVEEKDRSWCTSSRYCDMRAITIEVASDSKSPYSVTSAAYEKLIELVADICRRNGIKRLLWSDDKKVRLAGVESGYVQVHCDYKNKACPGEYLMGHMSDIVNKVNAKLGVSTSVVTNVSHETSYTKKDFIRDVQSATGAKVDGIAGPETLSKTPTLSAKKNRRHAAVRAVQKYLYALGYEEVGKADGITGAKFTAAVMRYQREHGCVSDGVISAHAKTWKKLLGLEV